MKTAVETPRRLDFGGEDTPQHGLELQEDRWQPPAVITVDDVVNARRWLQAYQTENGQVQDGVLKKWLATLVMGMATGLDERDVALKVNTLAFAVEVRPASLFNGDTLRLAMGTFSFVPTAKELIDFFERLEKAERDTAARLMKIVDIGVRQPRRDPNWTPAPDPMRQKRTPDELKAVGDICARIRANLADGPQPAKPAAAKDAAE